VTKGNYNLRRSRNGRLNRARREAEKLVSLLEAFEGQKVGIDVQEFWQAIREHGQQIAQCVHEANAYNNVMVGDNWPDTVEHAPAPSPDEPATQQQ
jgi:hypothetical protein